MKKKPDKKKTGKKKVKKPETKKQLDPLSQKPPVGLHAKKLQIMAEVPIIPCSAISKDRYGLRYAHTQACRVYDIYREKCVKHGLVIRRISGKTSNCLYPDFSYNEEGKRSYSTVDGVLFEGVWEIRDVASGQTETFGGSGLGDNMVWAANSSQTVAKKQALLDYFEVAWPQPTDHNEVIRNEMKKLKGEEFIAAMKQILPDMPYKIITQSGAIDALLDFFAGKKGKS